MAHLKLARFSYFCVPKQNGPVAERLGRALQKLPLQFESGRDLIKKVASKKAAVGSHQSDCQFFLFAYILDNIIQA